jgi:hypothetical protein
MELERERECELLDSVDVSALVDLGPVPLPPNFDDLRQALAEVEPETQTVPPCDVPDQTAATAVCASSLPTLSRRDPAIRDSLSTQQVQSSLAAARHAILCSLSGLLARYLPALDHVTLVRRHSVANDLVHLDPYAPNVSQDLVSHITSQLHIALSQKQHVAPAFAASSEQDRLEHLRSLVEHLTPDHVPDARQRRLANAFADLLVVLDRLSSLTRVDSSSLSNLGPAASQDDRAGFGGEEAYEALRRVARRSTPVVGLSELEAAETAVLWARVDDLLTRVVNCQTASSPRPASQHHHDLPPEYAEEVPPEYSAAVNAREAASTVSERDEKDDGPAGTAAESSSHNEKLHRDLDSLTLAIERLYRVSPQLANQRVDPARRSASRREDQLAALNDAIERMQKSRMDNQRAGLVPRERRERIQQDAVSDPEKAASAQEEAESEEWLWSEIERLQGRRMGNQRVELSCVNSVPFFKRVNELNWRALVGRDRAGSCARQEGPQRKLGFVNIISSPRGRPRSTKMSITS